MNITGPVVTITQIGDITALTSANRRSLLYLGVVRHGPGTVIGSPINQPQSIHSILGHIVDSYIANGKSKNFGGNNLTVNTGNTLAIDKASGQSYVFGGNFQSDPNNPDIVSSAALVAPSMLKYSGIGHIQGQILTSFDTTRFDDGGLSVLDVDLSNIVGGSTYVAHRIWMEPITNLIIFQYGQATYSNEANAIAGWIQEDLSLPTGLAESSHLHGVFIIVNNETNLNNSTFVPFTGAGGGGGTSVTVIDGFGLTNPNDAGSINNDTVLKNLIDADILNLVEAMRERGKDHANLISEQEKLNGRALVRNLTIAQSKVQGDTPFAGNADDMYAITFTTGSNLDGDQVVWESGGSTVGIAAIIDNGNLNFFYGVTLGVDLTLFSVPVLPNTEYSLIVNTDITNNRIRAYLRAIGDHTLLTDLDLIAEDTGTGITDYIGTDVTGVGNVANINKGPVTPGNSFLGTIIGNQIHRYSGNPVAPESDLRDSVELSQSLSTTKLTPNDIGSVHTWVDAQDPLADGSTPVDLQSIGTWQSKSGSNNFTTPGTDPVIDIDGFNGKPAVFYNGTQVHLLTTALNGPYTMIIVARQSGTKNRRIVSQKTAEGNKLFGWWAGNNKSLYIETSIHLNTFPASNLDAAKPVIYALTVNGNNKKFYERHNRISDTTINTQANWGELTLGGRFDVGNGEDSSCFIAEFAAFNKELSDTELHGLINYLEAKWLSPVDTGWHDIGDPGEPAFTNGWVNFDNLFKHAGFTKDPDGTIHLKGLIKSGTVGATAFTLPVGFRPSNRDLRDEISNNAQGRIDISEDGTVQVNQGVTNWISLFGISFREDA